MIKVIGLFLILLHFPVESISFWLFLVIASKMISKFPNNFLTNFVLDLDSGNHILILVFLIVIESHFVSLFTYVLMETVIRS